MARIFRPEPDTGAIVEPQPPALRLPLRHLEPLASPDPLDPLAVHCPPRVAQQGGDTSIAIATILLGQSDDVLGQRLLVVRPARYLAMGRPMLSEHLANPSFGHR
jgi:hypothetical protein